jgi:hypothetical protein
VNAAAINVTKAECCTGRLLEQQGLIAQMMGLKGLIALLVIGNLLAFTSVVGSVEFWRRECQKHWH